MGPGLSSEPSTTCFPGHLFADSVYNGPNLREALAKFGDWTIEIVTRTVGATGFQLLPRRWVVERTFPGSIATADWHLIQTLTHRSKDGGRLHSMRGMAETPFRSAMANY